MILTFDQFLIFFFFFIYLTCYNNNIYILVPKPYPGQITKAATILFSIFLQIIFLINKTIFVYKMREHSLDAIFKSLVSQINSPKPKYFQLTKMDQVNFFFNHFCLTNAWKDNSVIKIVMQGEKFITKKVLFSANSTVV